MVPRDDRKVYKMRPILESIVDRGSWFEIGKGWGRSVITGLARLDGWPVAVLASDPYYYAGAWTSDACRKAIRLIDLAQTFALPIVHFVDIPGFLIGKQAEESGVMRFGTQALAAIRDDAPLPASPRESTSFPGARARTCRGDTPRPAPLRTVARRCR